MLLKLEKVGSIEFAGNVIDITDPCYDKEVVCRVSRKILPGCYNCYVGFGNSEGQRSILALIILAESIRLDDSALRMKLDGQIGVDAGVAGFFENKPDYNGAEWDSICSYLYPQTDMSETLSRLAWIVDETGPLKCKGFFSQSGFGDGVYNFYRITRKRKFVGYKLEF